jgi:hypothetical protein
VLTSIDPHRALAPVWQADPDGLLLLSQASHVWTVIDAALDATGVKEPEYWFPGYYCESALPVLRALGRRIRFYPVTASLAPDWAACERMATERPPDVFTLAHCFGLENDAPGARRFSDRHGALLHEDFAHVLLPFGAGGATADCVSYSPRKFLPVADGGIMVVRGERMAPATRQAMARLPAAINPNRRWSLDAFRHVVFGREKRKALSPVTMDRDPPDTAPFKAIWMSRATRRLLAGATGSGELDQLARKRRSTVATHGADIAAAFGLDHLTPHPDAVTRWTGLRAPNEAAALTAINAMRANGINAGTWPGLPPEVKAEPSRYGEAWTLRRTLVRVTLK